MLRAMHGMISAICWTAVIALRVLQVVCSLLLDFSFPHPVVTLMGKTLPLPQWYCPQSDFPSLNSLATTRIPYQKGSTPIYLSLLSQWYFLQTHCINLTCPISSRAITQKSMGPSSISTPFLYIHLLGGKFCLALMSYIEGHFSFYK